MHSNSNRPLAGITVRTRRYSTVVQAFAESYPQAVATLDGRIQEGTATWATNAALKGSIDFSLIHNGEELLGFHDGPMNLTASPEALPLIRVLATQGVLRYELTYSRQSIFSRLKALLGKPRSDA